LVVFSPDHTTGLIGLLGLQRVVNMKSLASLGVVALCYTSQVYAGQAGPLPDCENGLLKSNKVCDRTASPRERAAALVAALQTREKLDNIVRYGKLRRR